jgi:hypothetical protein
MFSNFTHDSTPSEARKRGSGGGSPRKYDDPPTGPLDLPRLSTYFPKSFRTRQQICVSQETGFEVLTSYNLDRDRTEN